MAQSLKNQQCRDAGYVGAIPASGRSPGVEKATHFSILSWKVPWTEKASRL